MLHQTVIGLEAKATLEKLGLYPDVIFGPCGGGSRASPFPFLPTRRLTDRRWNEVEARLLRGKPRNDLAKELGNSEAAIRGKLSAQMQKQKEVEEQVATKEFKRASRFCSSPCAVTRR